MLMVQTVMWIIQVPAQQCSAPLHLNMKGQPKAEKLIMTVFIASAV
jgi:hypothetical protein